MKIKILTFAALFSAVLSAAEPLAFLSDIQGKMQIERDGKKIDLEGSCEALYKDDVIVPGKDGEAKIVFPDAIYDVRYPAQFRVQFASVRRLEGGKASEAKPITRSIRSAYGTEDETVSALIPPKELVANVVPAITRATEEVIVYSPKGQLFGDSPELLINGIADRTYEATLRKDGKQIGKAVPIRPGQFVSFAAFEAGKLQPDEIYELHIKFNGKIVNDPTGGSFYLMDEADRKKIEAAEKRFDSVKNNTSAMFFKANILYKKECFAETRVLAEKLVKAEPDNSLYRNLLKLANKALGYKE